jgi:hypothetical protein
VTLVRESPRVEGNNDVRTSHAIPRAEVRSRLSLFSPAFKQLIQPPSRAKVGAEQLLVTMTYSETATSTRSTSSRKTSDTDYRSWEDAHIQLLKKRRALKLP